MRVDPSAMSMIVSIIKIDATPIEIYLWTIFSCNCRRVKIYRPCVVLRFTEAALNLLGCIDTTGASPFLIPVSSYNELLEAAGEKTIVLGIDEA